VDEDAEPVLDLHPRVFIAALFGDQIGSTAPLSIVPGVVGEERDLARAVAEGKDAVEEEVRKLVGVDDALAVLLVIVRLRVGGGNQLGRDRRVEDLVFAPQL
jgi:hypothetical protein